MPESSICKALRCILTSEKSDRRTVAWKLNLLKGRLLRTAESWACPRNTTYLKVQQFPGCPAHTQLSTWCSICRKQKRYALELPALPLAPLEEQPSRLQSKKHNDQSQQCCLLHKREKNKTNPELSSYPPLSLCPVCLKLTWWDLSSCFLTLLWTQVWPSQLPALLQLQCPAGLKPLPGGNEAIKGGGKPQTPGEILGNEKDHWRNTRARCTHVEAMIRTAALQL